MKRGRDYAPRVVQKTNENRLVGHISTLQQHASEGNDKEKTIISRDKARENEHEYLLYSIKNVNLLEQQSSHDDTQLVDHPSLRRRMQTANATQFLHVQPSIRACECNGLSCITNHVDKHQGDAISVCLWSNWLDIRVVSNMTLHVDDIDYHPVVNGIANELTRVKIHGKVAVVTTMTISDFYRHETPSNLVVDATVSFVSSGGNGRRLEHSLGNPPRLLVTARIGKSRLVVGCVCLFVAIIAITSEVSLFEMRRRHCSEPTARQQHDDKECHVCQKSCIYSKQ